MKTQVQRMTLYLDKDLVQALREKAALTKQSVSELITEMIQEQLAEDADDLQAFRERADESVMSLEGLRQALQAHEKR